MGLLNINPSGKIRIYSVASHAANNIDPHGNFWIQSTLITSGLNVFGLTHFDEDVVMAAGKTINNADLSFIDDKLMQGLNADAYHFHYGFRPVEYLGYGARYEGATVNEIDVGTLSLGNDGVYNFYEWDTAVVEGVCQIVLRAFVPTPFTRWVGLGIINKLGAASAAAKVEVEIYDTNNDLLVLEDNVLSNTSWTEDTILISSGVFEEARPFTIVLNLVGVSGVTVNIADLFLAYGP